MIKPISFLIAIVCLSIMSCREFAHPASVGRVQVNYNDAGLPITRRAEYGRSIETTERDQLGATTTTERSANSETTRASIGLDPADYVFEGEFDRLLNRLEEEAKRLPIAQNRANYFPDDASVEDILRLFEGQTSETSSQLDGLIVPGSPGGQLAIETSTKRGVECEIQPDSNRNMSNNGRLVKSLPDSECPICFVPLKSTEPNTVITKCNHQFHVDCLRCWSAKSDECPMCRQRISRP